MIYKTFNIMASVFRVKILSFPAWVLCFVQPKKKSYEFFQNNILRYSRITFCCFTVRSRFMDVTVGCDREKPFLLKNVPPHI